MQQAWKGPLTQIDSRVKSPTRTQEIKCGLSIITLPSPVDFSLSEDNQTGSQVVPFQLNFVALEECLLRHGGTELRDGEHLDCGRKALLGVSTKPSNNNIDTGFEPTLRSGMNTAMVLLLPGERAKSATPSALNLFQTVERFPLS